MSHDVCLSRSHYSQIIRQPDNDYVTILAIGEDSPLVEPSSTIISVDERYRREPTKLCDFEEVVEVTNLVKPPGLTVHTDIASPTPGGVVSFQSHRSEPSSSATTGSFRRSPTTVGSTGMSTDRNPLRTSKNTHLSRSQDRKSRITNEFYEARERLEESLADAEPSVSKLSFTESGQRKICVVFPSESVNIPLGIDIAPVLNDKGSVMALEVTQIRDDGRVAIDGRISVGNQITEINRSTVSRMSLHQAYKCLRELSTVDEPELTIIQVERKLPEVATDSAMYAVQKANSIAITNEITVSVTKSSSGFGFGIRHRKSGSTMILIINSVHVDGPAFNFLKVGDRLLKINAITVSLMQLSEILSILRSFPNGESVSFTVSRDINNQKLSVSTVPERSQTSSILSSQTALPSSTPKLSPKVSGSRSNPTSPALRHRSPLSNQASTTDTYSIRRYEQMVAVHEPSESTEHLIFNIPFIQSRSAGLGIQVACHPWGLSYGPGLYIKKIIHGSAAHRDGRLRICDRLVGINHIDFRRFENYKVGFDIFSTMIKTLPLDDKSARIAVVRNKDPNKYRFDDDKETTKHENPKLSVVDTPSDTDEIETTMNAFNRLNPTRKSISEKRPLGSGNEVAHSQTFQKIIHERQTSAPTLNRNKDPQITFHKRPESFSVKQKRDAVLKTVSSPDENCAPSEEYIQTVLQLEETAALESSQVIVMRKKRREESREQKSPGLRCRNKITSIVDFFRKKNKSPSSTTRQSMFFDPLNHKDSDNHLSDDDEVKLSSKRRSVSHDPQDKSKQFQKKITSDDMVHEVIAGIKNVDEIDKHDSPPPFRLRNKKVEPAPSFKQAMANNEEQKHTNSIMHALISSEMGPDVLNDLRPKLAGEKHDKSRRKSMGLLGFLRRDHSPDKHKSMTADHISHGIPKRHPPPYNAVRKLASGDAFSSLSHSNDEFQGVCPPASLHDPDALIKYRNHAYSGDFGGAEPRGGTFNYEATLPHIVHYTSGIGNCGQNAFHMHHPTTAYVGPAPNQLNVHQRQVLQQQQRERDLQQNQSSGVRHYQGPRGSYTGTSATFHGPITQTSVHSSGSTSNGNYDYYHAFNAWFAQSGQNTDQASRYPAASDSKTPGSPSHPRRYENHPRGFNNYSESTSDRRAPSFYTSNHMPRLTTTTRQPSALPAYAGKTYRF